MRDLLFDWPKDLNGPSGDKVGLRLVQAVLIGKLLLLCLRCEALNVTQRDSKKGTMKGRYCHKIIYFWFSGRFPQRLGRGEVCSMPNHSLWSQRHFTAMSVAIAIYCHSYKDSCKSRRWQFSAHQFVEVIFCRQPIHIRPHLASATSACCLWNWVSNAFTRGHVQSLRVISVFPSWFYDNLSGALLPQWDFIGAWVILTGYARYYANVTTFTWASTKRCFLCIKRLPLFL